MILLTGAAGYIGSHVAFFLKQKKISFIGIDNFSAGNQFNKMHKFIKKIDIGDNKKICDLIKKNNFTDIIHAAAFSYPVEGERKKYKYKKNNYKKTIDFINYFKDTNIKSFIFLSSSNIYSDKKNSPYKENDETKPKNIYGKYKFLVEKYLKKKKYFKRVIIFRLFNVVGYLNEFKFKLHKSKNQRFLTKIIDSAFNKKKINLNYFKINKKLYSPERDFIDLYDVIKIINKTLNKASKFNKYNVYNLGSGKKTSLEEIILIIEKILKKKVIIKKKMLHSKEVNITWSAKNRIENKLSIKIGNKLNKIINSSVQNFKLNDNKIY